MRVATVLRSGGDFTAGHVRAMKAMLDEYLPGHEFLCLSDVEGVPGRIPLEHDWPGWWAKMELCRPDIEGSLLYLELDTVVVGDLTPLVADASRTIVLRDVYRGDRDPLAVQAGPMLLTEEDRALVWDEWIGAVRHHMRKRSEQPLWEAVLQYRCQFFQDTHPGMLVGFKTDLDFGRNSIPEDARLVVFHGQPRPWTSGVEWAEAPFR